MGVLLIAIALVSGFLFTNRHKPARFEQKRSVGWNSYFHVASWGTLFGVMSAVICLMFDYFNIISKLFDYYESPLSLGGLTVNLDDLKLAAWSISTLALSISFGWLSQIFYALFPDKLFKLIAKNAQKDHLDLIILEASATSFPVLITLKSRKCYVGLCYGEAETTSLQGERGSHIAILPFLSGYRDKDTLSLELNTNYDEHYDLNGINTGENERLSLDDFKNVIPKSEIESLSFFDLETYVKFKEIEAKTEKLGVLVSSYSVNSIKVE